MPLASAASRGETSTRDLGITVMPEFIQSEGIEGVLRNVQRTGANAVCTSPYVMEAISRDKGGREPPVDAGAGGVRLLDRPLWGKRELWVRTSPSFHPRMSLYRGLRYQPAEPDELTRCCGNVVEKFVQAAREKGLRVYLQVQAAIPPGYRVQFGGPQEEDKPRLPNGSVLSRNVSNNGSLASAAIRNYTEALLRDLCSAYPKIDGIRVDWPEYPPYFLDSIFFDFSDPARKAASRLGIDWDRMQRDTASVRHYLLSALTNRDLELFLAGDGGRFALLSAFRNAPGFAESMRFKSLLVTEMLDGFRKVLRECGDKELVPNFFPPPFTTVSGVDFRQVSGPCHAFSVKLYTMHWPMIVRFYGDELLKANPRLSKTLLADALVRATDIDERARGPLSWYHYPDPATAHPVSAGAIERKIVEAQSEAAVPVYALAHGYGPADDFEARLKIAWKVSRGKVWINRYGYLSDAKIERIRAATV